MLKKEITNAILDAMFGRRSSLGYTNAGSATMTRIINGTGGIYLGLSTTTPVISESGITGFTEPTDSEYKRVLVGGGDLARSLWYMDAAQGGIIKNGKQILFPAAKKRRTAAPATAPSPTSASLRAPPTAAPSTSVT